MHSVLPFILLLGSAAAERKIIFGRSIHMRQRSLPRRIRTAQRETSAVTEEVATDEAHRILIQDSFREDDASFGLDAISRMPSPFDFSMLGSISMSISHDISTPIIEPPTYTTPTPSSVATSAPLDPNADLGSLFAIALFEDVSQCAGLDLDTDSCMVSTFSAAWMGGMWARRQRSLHVTSGMIRLLQTPDENKDDCGAVPQVPEQSLRAILTEAKDQCEKLGSDTTDEDFDRAFETFKQLFASEKCWAALCDDDYAAALSFKVYFDYGATCAGVDLNVHDCVYDKMIDLLVVFSNAEDPSYTPTEDELTYIVSTLLVTPAKDHCIAKGVDMGSTDWNKVSSDVVAILSSLASTECATGPGADQEPRSSYLAAEANGTGGSSPGTYTMTFVVASVGCAVAIAVLVAGIYRLNKRKNMTPLEELNNLSPAEIYRFM